MIISRDIRSLKINIGDYTNCALHIFQLFCAGLGDAWGSAPLCNNPRETCIKELGSHLLQVRKQIITFFSSIFKL